jgi:hypothetical protein
MGLLYKLTLWSSVCVWALDSVVLVTSRGEQGSRRGRYWPFPQLAPHPAGLEIPTRHPSKISNSRVGLGMAGRVEQARVVRVGFHLSLPQILYFLSFFFSSSSTGFFSS